MTKRGTLNDDNISKVNIWSLMNEKNSFGFPNMADTQKNHITKLILSIIVQEIIYLVPFTSTFMYSFGKSIR